MDTLEEGDVHRRATVRITCIIHSTRSSHPIPAKYSGESCPACPEYAFPETKPRAISRSPTERMVSVWVMTIVMGMPDLRSCERVSGLGRRGLRVVDQGFRVERENNVGHGRVVRCIAVVLKDGFHCVALACYREERSAQRTHDGRVPLRVRRASCLRSSMIRATSTSGAVPRAVARESGG